MQHYNYSLSDMENMLPWEREIYLNLLLNMLKERKEEAERQNLRR